MLPRDESSDHRWQDRTASRPVSVGLHTLALVDLAVLFHDGASRRERTVLERATFHEAAFSSFNA